MLEQQQQMNLARQPENRVIQNQPTSVADSATEDMAGEADEPPDSGLSGSVATKAIVPRSQFQKSSYPSTTKSSLLTQMIHTSESDSHVDEDDYAFYEPNRAHSSASTYSRSSALSIAELTSSTGHTSPHTNSPSPPLSARVTVMPPVFKQNLFQVPSTTSVKIESIPPTQKTAVDEEAEQKLLLGLNRKRCITFACASKNTVKPDMPKRAESAVEVKEEPPRRNSSLRFLCPSRHNTDTAVTKSRARLMSPPPPVKRAPAAVAQPKHRDSDATLRTNSPKIVKKTSSVTARSRRDSLDSDVSRSEAMRFHEFASSEEEVDDWTKESGCYERRLTIDDTLAIENDLRKIGREVEEDEDEEDEDDQDEDEDEDEDEDVEGSAHAGYVSDEGFRTDDEDGFAQSDDDSDGDPDYDWWAPGRTAVRENLEHIRPSPRPRSNSESSIESEKGGIPISLNLRRKCSRPLRPNSTIPPPELPDSTDFVCGTLDEDKPLEQAYMNHLEQRRAAKHKVVPQDIDPTFPASDPEIDDEEDEVSDHLQTESDHPMFFHGQADFDDGERRTHRLAPKKRSPHPSPRRLRSPAPAKRTTLRSPPPARRARSPAPLAFQRLRLSSSVPRRRSQHAMRAHFDDVEEEQDNTPRFNRRAIDIVVGLAKKRERRREKMHEKLCRKAAKKGEKKPMQPGKGAERMRDLGIGLNEYRGRKSVVVPRAEAAGEVHMLSY